MQVSFKNPKTGELKNVKIGWSWTLFLFSGFLGIPLFMRRLYIWGFFFLVLWVVSFFSGQLLDSDGALATSIVLSILFPGLGIWMGLKGNEMTAKNYLEQGWSFSEPNEQMAKFARGKWGIQLEAA